MYIRPNTSPLRRVMVRPFEHFIAAMLAIGAVQRAMGYGGPISQMLSGALSIAWASLGAIAAAFIIAGIQWRGSSIMARGIEQVGWYAAIVVFAIRPLLIALGFDVPPADYDYPYGGLILGAAALLRVIFLRRETAAERETVAAICDER